MEAAPTPRHTAESLVLVPVGSLIFLPLCEAVQPFEVWDSVRFFQSANERDSN